MGAQAISGGLGVGLNIYQAIQAGKEKKEAADALANYQRQELTNVADGLQVSTLGSDLQREEQARLASGQIQALQESGTRGLIGGLGRVQAQNNQVNAEIGAGLDMQQKQIDQMRAEDQTRIRSMQENREIGDINALSSQYQAGKQDQNMAFGNIVQGAGMFGGAMGQLGGLNKGGDAGGFSGATLSGTPTDMVNKNYQSTVGGNNTYNPANTFGNFFSQNPYVPQQGPQNAPSWYNNIPNTKYF